jgi:hypothetical protein
MTEGASGRRRNPPPAACSALTPSPSTSPTTDASAGTLSWVVRTIEKLIDGSWPPLRPPQGGSAWRGTTFCDSEVPVLLGTTRGRTIRWSSRAGRAASSSPLSCRALSSAAAVMTTLLWRGEVMTRTTPTCRSSPPQRWVRRHSTTAPVMDHHWRRRHTPLPSAS